MYFNFIIKENVAKSYAVLTPINNHNLQHYNINK